MCTILFKIYFLLVKDVIFFSSVFRVQVKSSQKIMSRVVRAARKTVIQGKAEWEKHVLETRISA